MRASQRALGDLTNAMANALASPAQAAKSFARMMWTPKKGQDASKAEDKALDPEDKAVDNLEQTSEEGDSDIELGNSTFACSIVAFSSPLPGQGKRVSLARPPSPASYSPEKNTLTTHAYSPAATPPPAVRLPGASEHDSGPSPACEPLIDSVVFYRQYPLGLDWWGRCYRWALSGRSRS
jgi:hypothetical protein